jgi:hypothetical protein
MCNLILLSLNVFSLFSIFLYVFGRMKRLFYPFFLIFAPHLDTLGVACSLAAASRQAGWTAPPPLSGRLSGRRHRPGVPHDRQEPPPPTGPAGRAAVRQPAVAAPLRCRCGAAPAEAL